MFLPNRYASGIEFSQKSLGDRYYLDLIRGNGERSNVLVITFFAFGMVNPRTIQMDEPWAFNFVRSQGVSVLGVKPATADWYRGEELHRYFRSAEFSDLAASFDRVIFYGTSMGAYAGLVFSQALPSADVISLNPQTTLDTRIVPWEPRFKVGQEQDWDGDFNDGATTVERTGKVYVTYDPFFMLDRRHVERLPASGMVLLKVPMVGHSTAVWLTKMGLLKGLFIDILNDTFNADAFHRSVRKRRDIAHYYLEMARCAGGRRAEVRRWCLAKAETMAEDDASAYLEIAALHEKNADFASAEQVLFHLRTVRPNLPHAPYQLSRLMRRQHRLGEALEYAQTALSIAPKNAVYQDWLVSLQTA
ncbi:hypothetical protein [Sphingobium cupriresistens]|uniref:Tetratricopeptide repeat protein n=1 Tax=Sphingobium cupriresistens TaxID=1132417 RepID=A0A8G2DVC8_9SPHN|nr:hypothetical protein [Sphingobium cupriresistens]RYM07979.1 hypothetical protein EWH12_17750 [Sphingobium cupriresistens]